MERTFDHYCKAIKHHLADDKLLHHREILRKPSPAQLRNLCTAICENGLNHSDDLVFRTFFGATKDEDLQKAIRKFDIEKFRPVRNFLLGNNTSTNVGCLNLIAVISDFNPRPWSRFLKQGVATVTDPEPHEEATAPCDPKPAVTDMASPRTGRWIPVLMLLFLGCGFFIKAVFFDAKECMQWQQDRYVVVDCQQQDTVYGTGVIALDAAKLGLRKIEVKKDAPCKVGNKAIIWYCKQDNNVAFFNAPGHHPVTGKALVPASPHMVAKWGK